MWTKRCLSTLGLKISLVLVSRKAVKQVHASISVHRLFLPLEVEFPRHNGHKQARIMLNQQLSCVWLWLYCVTVTLSGIQSCTLHRRSPRD